jgi:hypothetical protein
MGKHVAGQKNIINTNVKKYPHPLIGLSRGGTIHESGPG